MGLIFTQIQEKLLSLNPSSLDIIDETYKHANHLDSNARETHFKIIIISNVFQGMSQIQIHRLIYKLLDFEMKSNIIHALTIRASAS
jgi:stress-induced morphogen